jgi:hypothetical protein
MSARDSRRFSSQRSLLTTSQQSASKARRALLKSCRTSVLRMGGLFPAAELASRLSEVIRPAPWIIINKENAR